MSGEEVVRFLSSPSTSSSRMIFSPRPSSSRRDSGSRGRVEGEARGGALASRFSERRRGRVTTRLSSAPLSVGWPLPVPDRRAGSPTRCARSPCVPGRPRQIGAAPGAKDINYNWMEPARTIKIRVDQDPTRLVGLSSQDLAQALNTGPDRRDSHADAQRHLSRRRAGTRPRPSSACRWPPSERFPDPAVERTDCSPEPDRLRR